MFKNKIKVRKEGGSKERRKEEVKLSVFMDIVLQKLSPWENSQDNKKFKLRVQSFLPFP